jgi:cell division protein FtsN
MPAQGGVVVRAVLLIIIFVLTQSSIAGAINDKEKPKKPKQQVSAFLARCRADLESCTNKISDISLEMVSNVADPSWCPTAETDDPKAVTPKTVDWLSAHPKLATKPTDEGIKTALRGLYPCKR